MTSVRMSLFLWFNQNQTGLIINNKYHCKIFSYIPFRKYFLRFSLLYNHSPEYCGWRLHVLLQVSGYNETLSLILFVCSPWRVSCNEYDMGCRREPHIKWAKWYDIARITQRHATWIYSGGVRKRNVQKTTVPLVGRQVALWQRHLPQFAKT